MTTLPRLRASGRFNPRNFIRYSLDCFVYVAILGFILMIAMFSKSPSSPPTSSPQQQYQRRVWDEAARMPGGVFNDRYQPEHRTYQQSHDSHGRYLHSN